MTAGRHWWAPLRRRPHDLEPPRARLLVLPHSGGGPNRYRELVADLPEHVEVLGLTLPGRERRMGEPVGATPDEVVGSLDEMHGSLPTVVFGHSLGAGLGLHVAHALGWQCRAVVASAAVPRERGRLDAEGSDEDLLRILELGDGEVPPEVLQDSDWRAAVLTTLRADLRLGAQAAERMADLRIAAPITVLCGREDRLIPVDALPDWRAHTTGSCEVVVYPGGHFALFDTLNRRPVVGALERHLAAAASARPGATVRAAN